MAGPARTTRRRRSNQDRHASPNSIESPIASTSSRGRPHSHPSSARTKAPSSSPFPSRSPCHRDHTRTEKRPGRTPTTSRPPRGLDPTPLPTCGRGETSWATCTLAKARTKAWYSAERQRRSGRTCLPNRLGWTEKSEFVPSYFSREHPFAVRRHCIQRVRAHRVRNAREIRRNSTKRAPTSLQNRRRPRSRLSRYLLRTRDTTKRSVPFVGPRQDDLCRASNELSKTGQTPRIRSGDRDPGAEPRE